MNRKRNYGENLRRCDQLVRLVQTCLAIRRLGSTTLPQLRFKLDSALSQRTIRRDLAVLMRLGWIEPSDNDDGETIWTWSRSSLPERLFSEPNKRNRKP